MEEGSVEEEEGAERVCRRRAWTSLGRMEEKCIERERRGGREGRVVCDKEGGGGMRLGGKERGGGKKGF